MMSLDALFEQSHIFHRSFSKKPLYVASASGLILTLDSSSQILDATGGPAVACLGHNQSEEVFLFRDTSPGGTCTAILCLGMSPSWTLATHTDASFPEKALGPGTVAALFAETIAGSTLACVLAVPGYFQAMRGVCDKYGALLVLDEVRTLTFAKNQLTGYRYCVVWEEAVQCMCADIQTVGKSLGGSFIPLSSILDHQDIFEVVANVSGSLAGGHTPQAHPVACASALTVQRIVSRDNLLENIRTMGALLEKLLREFIEPLLLVGNVRGRGLFWAVECMLDRETQTPFHLDDDFSCKIKDTGLDVGLNVPSNMGFVGMQKIDTAAITPPYIVTETEIRTIVELLKIAIERVSEPYLAARRHAQVPSVLQERVQPWL
ncbi:related to alanine-glyoxylate aminotransferase AGT2 [Phialocephala subalpina]|uniref:Related to alanine-glyoxylate aminotransferase AGT2 n=1 Tax=Phialocephala subalpina TaxID=576137 RepID=A0A1L7WH18_9HELO|nr:related to alanine-glyoxylate aminotransferase AGT2 [Phialocephala subalpina]